MILKDKGLLILIICFAIVSAADVATTVFAIENGAREMNPVANTIITNPFALIAMKLVGIGIIVTMVVWTVKRYPWHPNIGYFALALVIGVASGAVINNVCVLNNMGLLHLPSFL